jgi:hypothetical protein
VKRRKCETCGKNIYASSGAAAAVAAHQSRENGPLRIYQCPHGKGFHLTHTLAVPVGRKP